MLKKIIANPLLLTAALLIIAAVAIWIIIAVTDKPDLKDGAEVPLRVDRKRITATVAASDEARANGLAGFAQPGDDQGMLFVLPKSQIAAFVMKGVSYPIDIIWIAGETVTEVTPGVPPEPDVPDDQLTRYSPSGPVDRVLEVRSGWATQYGIQPGDPVRLLSF